MKDELDEEIVIESNEPSYREQKAEERKANKAMKAFYKLQDKLLERNPNAMSFESKILVGLGSMFKDASKFDWNKEKIDGLHMKVSNEEYYAEVHDRPLGSPQAFRYEQKNITTDKPGILKANLRISKTRMKHYEFNGITSAVIAFAMLFVASGASIGINYGKSNYAQIATVLDKKIDEAKAQATVDIKTSEYVEKLATYSNAQLSEEKHSSTPGTLKEVVAKYYLLKKAKQVMIDSYPEGQISETVQSAIATKTKEINDLRAIILAHQNDGIKTVVQQ